MTHPFLSPEWFTAVDALIAAAGDLGIPEAMRAAEINVTVTTSRGDKLVYVKDGQLPQGHGPEAPAAITLTAARARRVMGEAGPAAGIQAVLAGEVVAAGE